MTLAFARAPSRNEDVPAGNSITITLDDARAFSPGDEIKGTSRTLGC